MVTVYVVTLNSDYEGQDPAAVYISLEDAKTWVESVYQDPSSDFCGYDSYGVYKRTVGEPPVRDQFPISLFQIDWSTRGRNRPWKWYDQQQVS